MKEVEVALAASAREWPDRVHRFLTDHGGARVRTQILTPEDALAENYQVLVIDDISSFLTPRLVAEVQRRGRQVLGVFDPEDSPDAKERLRECGVDAVIEADASADEFVVALRALAVLAPELPDTAASAITSPLGLVVAVGAPPGGCGATEVAIGLASELARYGSTVLVDLDELAPSVAQRLGLPMLPNLRTAIDATQHHQSTLEAALSYHDRLAVLTGLSNDRDWMDVRTFEVRTVLEELRGRARHVVINVGSQLGEVGFGEGGGRFALSRLGISLADQVVIVGLPTPVGVSRLTAWSVAASGLNPHAPQTLIVNRVPRGRFRRAEISREVVAATGREVRFIGEDAQIRTAAWAGSRPRSGRLWRACRALTRELLTHD